VDLAAAEDCIVIRRHAARESHYNRGWSSRHFLRRPIRGLARRDATQGTAALSEALGLAEWRTNQEDSGRLVLRWTLSVGFISMQDRSPTYLYRQGT